MSLIPWLFRMQCASGLKGDGALGEVTLPGANAPHIGRAGFAETAATSNLGIAQKTCRTRVLPTREALREAIGGGTQSRALHRFTCDRPASAKKKGQPVCDDRLAC